MIKDGIILLASYPKTGSTWLKWMMREAVAAEMPVEDFMPSFPGKTLPPAKVMVNGWRKQLYQEQGHESQPDCRC